MASKSLGSAMLTVIFIFIIVLSHPMHPQSDATTLTSRQLFQDPRYPPCLCCQTDAPPPPNCYCACFSTRSEKP